MGRGQRRLATGIGCGSPGEGRGEGAGPAAGGLAPVRRRQARGAALVEFAIALPVLLVILLGIIDLGRVFYAYEALANAAREGARYCALTRDCEANIVSKVRGEVSALVPVSSAAVTYPDGGPSQGRRVRVTVTSPFDLVTPFMDDVIRGVSNGVVDGPLVLQVSAEMAVWYE